MAKKSLAEKQAEYKEKHIWPSRKEAMLRALVIDGMKIGEIAEKFKISGSTFSRYRSERIWQEREAKMREDTYTLHKGRLSSLVEPAIDALKQTVRSLDEGIKLKAATEILDRTGFPKGLQIETDMKPVINLFMPVHLRGGVVDGDE